MNLFFGAEVSAPWPHDLPEHRLINESSRHLTLVFLGEVPVHKVKSVLPSFPIPPFKVGLVGKSDELLFLPDQSAHPRVVAYHIDWISYETRLRDFQKTLVRWLQSHQFAVEDKRQFLSHITIARDPKDRNTWQTLYEHIPFTLNAIHLYESVGNLTYVPIWTFPLMLPFEEMEHTADVAFRIRAEHTHELHLHAQIALAFKWPSLLPFLFFDSLKGDLDDIIIALNASISRADEMIGSPIKAISFHGKIEKDKQGILQWEMIIDV